jgi:hypothetical protein
MSRVTVAVVSVAASGALLLAAPSGAGANPLPQCVQELEQDAPGYAATVVANLEQGRLPQVPRLMGPFVC